MRVRGRAAAALLGLTVFGAAVAWLAFARSDGSGPVTSSAAALPARAASPPSPSRIEQEVNSAPEAFAQAQPERPEAPRNPPRHSTPIPPEQGKAPPAPVPESGKAQAPTFEVVRIEPNGESVIAGRGAPGAAIEMLRNGRSHARAFADASGLFALVPPPLAPGSHEIGLTSIAPDGTRAQSRESVTVVISEDRTRKPLVTLTSPDRPTVVLSAPDAPEPKKPPTAEAAGAAEGGGGAVAANPPAQPAQPNPPPGLGAQPPAARPNVKIVSVEAEEGGRLFVSGDAAAWATVRLYLNDSFIAPGGTGGDGKVSFAISGGVRPGDYRVRLDDVDPVSGDVKSRAEVAFNVPAPLMLPLPPQAEPLSPDATIAERPAAGTEEASKRPLASAVPPGSSTAPAQQTTADPSPAPQAGSAERPGSSHVTAPPDGASNAPRVARTAEPGIVIVPPINTTIVSRGDNLWRISRRIYGEGTRYTVIYDANQTQIRNPDRIYPGQIFVLPSEQPPAEPARKEP